jgi:hypothetical protein
MSTRSITRELQPEVASPVMEEATSRCVASLIPLSERNEGASRDRHRPRRRAYDHRLRNSIVAGRALDDSLKVPASTMRSWRARGHREVVSSGDDAEREALARRVACVVGRLKTPESGPAA